MGLEAQQVFAIEDNPASHRLIDPRNYVEQGSFARAVRADHSKEFARQHLEETSLSALTPANCTEISSTERSASGLVAWSSPGSLADAVLIRSISFPAGVHAAPLLCR